MHQSVGEEKKITVLGAVSITRASISQHFPQAANLGGIRTAKRDKTPAMNFTVAMLIVFPAKKLASRACWPAGLTVALLQLCSAAHFVQAQAPAPPKPATPEWAQPGSAAHTQVAPPKDFHRPSRNFDTPIGIFEGQSDIGSAILPGSASYDTATNNYTINSAGYNVWYTRDEFRFLWKKMSGDISLAADIGFPDPNGYGDRKAVLIIRQNLEDDSKEALIGFHGLGMIQLAQRPEKGERIKDIEYRIGGRGRPGGAGPDSLVNVMARRVGIEKHGDSFALYLSLEGEPMHQFGPPIQLHIEGPFYIGIGFCSHMPDKVDTAVMSNVVLENSAGKFSEKMR